MVGIDSQLQVGQVVAVQEQPAGYQVAILSPEQPGPRVVEVGQDYLVIDDPEAGVKTRIPAHLLLPLTPPAAPAPVMPAALPQAA